ncbi:type II toxin-antitoxin system VapC family toxin [Phyllobacterium myrsinacearum]|nr:type II toxin-antitoxin system VapC family toxin [Phyllobacterium myrsinacearum]PWV94707.1 hypothetical protein DEV92_102159 [Phyllobacterium myrsinacearum]RZV07184.1 hypothetical protein EV654_1853 [Phyllobacterium myrsinacearum]
MFILDTNFISEMRRPDRADANVMAWASTIPFSHFFISAITILEIEQGLLLVERRDMQQGAILRLWRDNWVLPRFEGRVLAVDTAVAQRCAHLHVPDPQSERDALIAATALVHGMVVVTRNIADFASAGVRTLNPWNI